MATHSSILAWTIPWTGARWAVVHGATKGQTLLEQLSTSTHTVILRLHGHSDRFDARTVPVTFHSIAMVMLPAYPKIFSSVSITSNSLLLLPQGIFNLLFRDPGPRKIQKALGKLLRNKETGHKGSPPTWMHQLIEDSMRFCCCCCIMSVVSDSTLCDPTDGSQPGSPVPGILQARTLEWVAISFSNA